MSDSVTIRPWTERIPPAGSEYLRLAREIKKQEAAYPRKSAATIKAAVKLAFNQAGERRDPALIDRYVALYLSSSDKV